MTIVPMCLWCKHYHTGRGHGPQCDAYPEEIPDEIIMNRFDHRKPHKGDGGIMFEPLSSFEPRFDPFLDNPGGVPELKGADY